MANQLAKMIARGLGGQKLIGFGPMTLVRVQPGARGTELTAGTALSTTNYKCKGRKGVSRRAYWQFWQNAQLTGAQARASFVGFTILGATLPDGIEPRAGDRIVHQGKTFTISADGASDPTGVGAVWECMTRAGGG